MAGCLLGGVQQAVDERANDKEKYRDFHADWLS